MNARASLRIRGERILRDSLPGFARSRRRRAIFFASAMGVASRPSRSSSSSADSHSDRLRPAQEISSEVETVVEEIEDPLSEEGGRGNATGRAAVPSGGGDVL